MEARIVELREKTNAGTLTPEEDTEYKDFVEAVDPDFHHAGEPTPN